MIIGLVSFHTCPMADLGEKDTGGMNVYLLNLARSLDLMGHTVFVYTRRHDSLEHVEIPIGSKSKLVHIVAGTLEDSKDDLVEAVSSCNNIPYFIKN